MPSYGGGKARIGKKICDAIEKYERKLYIQGNTSQSSQTTFLSHFVGCWE
jgi:hypothetical protein